ncbi:MAG: hypothetical protein PHQ36_03780 [Anaerolineales bacterium]|nr:hypothetical protein [Anaerolineales bacterium]
MIVEIISWIAVGAILLASATILTSRDWRMSLGALALQYLAAFWLIIRHLPFVMGSAKLIAGWMVVAVLGMTRLGLSNADEESEPFSMLRGRWFQFALIGIAAFVAAGSTARIEAVIPGLGLQVIAGSLLLIGIGVAHLGVSSNLLHTILGLLTMLTGFEIIYSAIESSILVVGLLAIINLGLGLVGSYLLLAGSTPPEIEEEQ